MKVLNPLCCALLLIVSQSTIHADGLYKWKDASGNMQYSDRPPANVNAKLMELPKITIIDNYADQWKPIKFDETEADKPIQAKSIANKTYTKLTFLAPKKGQGIRANDGDVSAMISIKPPLKKGHQLVFSIDGKAMEKGKSRTKNFSNLERGNHTLSIKVIDRKGSTLKTSSVGFNVLRTTLNKKQQKNQQRQIPKARSYNDARKQQAQSGS